MGSDSNKDGVDKVAASPETEDIDANWDDDGIDELDPAADLSDRATLIPDIEPEELAAKMMAPSEPTAARRTAGPGGRPTPAVPPNHQAEYLSPPKVPIFAGSAPLPKLPSEAPPSAPVKQGGVRIDRGVPELAAKSAEHPAVRIAEEHLPSGARPAAEALADTPDESSGIREAPTPPPLQPPPEPAVAAEPDLSLDLTPPPAALALADSQPRDDTPAPRDVLAAIEASIGASPEDDSLEAPIPGAPGREPQITTAADSGDPVKDMKDRYAVGDFTGALVIAESILETEPEHTEAKRYAQSCREVLTQMYAARLGALDQIVAVAIPADQIRWLSLDHRAGFLLSLVDGMSSIEDILDVSGMSRLDALRIMFTLVQQRVVSLQAP